MIIARTRVWALAVVASLPPHDSSVSASQYARRSRYGRPSVREQRTGHCVARWRLRTTMSGGTGGNSACLSRFRQHEYRFWKQHQLARRALFCATRRWKRRWRRPLGQRCRRARPTVLCSAGSLVTTCNGINSSLGVDVGYKYPISTRGEHHSPFNTSDSIQHIVTIEHSSQAGRLCDLPRSRWVRDRTIPALCRGRPRGRALQLWQRNGADVRPSPRLRSWAKTTPSSGVAAGLGVDWAVTPDVFVRAEWEYIAFGGLNKTRPKLNTGYLGVGARF